MFTRRQILGTALALSAGRPAWAAAAEAGFPSRPIRFVVPFPPGGGTNFLGRALAQKLTTGLGQPVVVENREGAGGSIGASLVAKADANGYTMLMGASSTMAVNPHLYKTLPYDTLKHFLPVSLLATVPIVLFVNKSLPVRSVQELIAYAKANPGKLNFASAGNGSVGHLSGELLKKMAGIDIVHIPFKGSAPAMTSLIGGQVQMMFDSPLSGMPHVKAGTVAALACGGAQRSAILPGMPTMAESGLPEFKAVLWYGLYVPAGTAEATVARLNAETVKALRSADLRESLERDGFEAVGNSVAEFDAFWKADFARWSGVVEGAGIKLD